MQTWQLQSNNGEPFSLTFDTFDVGRGFNEDDDDGDGFIDCDFDYVYISGGTSSSPQPKNKKHCNHQWSNNGPTGPIPGPFTGTKITVSFTGAGTRTGFLAVVTGDVTVTTDVTGESGVGKWQM